MLEVTVDNRDHRCGGSEHSFNNRRRKAATIEAADKADASVGFGKFGDMFCGAVSGAVVDKYDFPLGLSGIPCVGGRLNITPPWL